MLWSAAPLAVWLAVVATLYSLATAGGLGGGAFQFVRVELIFSIEIAAAGLAMKFVRSRTCWCRHARY